MFDRIDVNALNAHIRIKWRMARIREIASLTAAMERLDRSEAWAHPHGPGPVLVRLLRRCAAAGIHLTLSEAVLAAARLVAPEIEDPLLYRNYYDDDRAVLDPVNQHKRAITAVPVFTHGACDGVWCSCLLRGKWIKACPNCGRSAGYREPELPQPFRQGHRSLAFLEGEMTLHRFLEQQLPESREATLALAAALSKDDGT
jgi:hypothetical protein